MPHPAEEKWTSKKELGAGGQGGTFLAESNEDPSLQVALKLLKNNKSKQARGRMAQEVISLQVLAEAGGSVPRVIDHNTQQFADEPVKLYVAMQYVPGPTLRELVDTAGPLSLEVATRIVVSLCKTIELAHSLQILHRDLKPENIIVRNLQVADAVIVDYGLSFNADVDGEGITETNDTFRNKFLDLPETNTPSGNRRDPRSDVTAVCGILYFLLIGEVPGQLRDENDLPPHMRPGFAIYEKLTKAPQLDQLEVLFNRGFSPNVESRFQTVAEFRDRLLSASAGNPSSEPTEDIQSLAARLSASIIRNNRKAQLQELEKSVPDVMQRVYQIAERTMRNLNAFMPYMGQNEPGDKSPFPVGIDRVWPLQLRIQLNFGGYNFLRAALYTIGSSGTQCVIVRQNLYRDDDASNPQPKGEWNKVVWYEPPGLPDFDAVAADIQAWMRQSMSELHDLMVEKGR